MNQEPQSSALRLRIDFAQASDPGRDPNKQVNEDSCGYAETRFGHLAVLCDGMGGHYGGKEASRTAITTIFEVFEQLAAGTSGAQALKVAIEEAGRRVYQLGGPPDNRARPGSTVVAMLLSEKGLDVAHVGDSRAYIIRSNQIYPLTRDHSMVQGMIDAGMLTEETAMGHPDSNKITRALGMRPDVEVELRPETMEVFPGDLLLQSSDGLTDLALARDILGCARQALASGGVENACNMLVRLANDRGGHDNITVQIVRVADTGPKVRNTIPEQPAGAARPAAAAPATTAFPTAALPQTAAMHALPGIGPVQPTTAWAPPIDAGTPGPASAAPRSSPPLAGAPNEPRKPTLNDGSPMGNTVAVPPTNWAATAYQAGPSPVAGTPAPGSTASYTPLTPTPPPVGFTPPPGAMSGPGQGPGFGPGQGPGFGPGQGPGFGPGQGPGFGPGQGPGLMAYGPNGPNPALGQAYGQPISMPGGPTSLSVSKGGIVFVIMGLSGVIAVLIIVIVVILLSGK